MSKNVDRKNISMNFLCVGIIFFTVFKQGWSKQGYERGPGESVIDTLSGVISFCGQYIYIVRQRSNLLESFS